MAEQGKLYLNNKIIDSMCDTMKKKETDVQTLLYNQYKSAYILSQTSHYRGKGAASFKKYITISTINIISELLDISADMSMVIQYAQSIFNDYADNNGAVEERVLDYINKTLESKKNTYDGSKDELSNVLKLASNYIPTKSLSLEIVNDEYTNTKSEVEKIRENLYNADNTALEYMNVLMNRIENLKSLIINTSNYCYNDENKLNLKKINSIKNQKWYTKSGNIMLYVMLKEDPFVYAAGQVAVKEEQWSVGLCSDIYAYMGYSMLSASGEVKFDNGVATTKGQADFAKWGAYAQMTNYLSTKVNATVGHVEGEVKAGFSDEYVGFKVTASGAVAQVDGSVILGTDEMNAYIKGEASFLSANGKTAMEVKKNGEFAIGFDGSAALAEANAHIGVSFLNYDYKEYDKDGKTTYESPSLFGVDLDPSIGIQGGGALWAERKHMYETDYFYVSSNNVKVSLKVLAGLNVKVTYPSVEMKPLW